MNLPDAPPNPENALEELQLVAAVLIDIADRLEQIAAMLTVSDES